MKITFLGTCSGTEPMRGRKHVSLAIQRGADVFFFDAGEGCSHTAHLAGIDLLATRAIFISHTHMDHTGGLANLLWTVRKLDRRCEDRTRSISGRTLRVYIPNLDVWQGVLKILSGTEAGFSISFALVADSYEDGLIYGCNGFQVTAQHNGHLGEPPSGEAWRSFSFRIEADGKSVVYSGDVSDVRDLDPIIDHADLVLMETGHHRVEDVCRYLKDSGKEFGTLGFVHHGRDILAQPRLQERKARSIIGDRVFIADDGMTWEL